MAMNGFRGMIGGLVWLLLTGLGSADEFEVPNLVGKSVGQALDDVQAADSTAKVIVAEARPESDDGEPEEGEEGEIEIVIAQAPRPGATLTLGEIVHLIVNPISGEPDPDNADCPLPWFVWILMLAAVGIIVWQGLKIRDLNGELRKVT